MRKRKEIEKAVDAFTWKFPDNTIIELLLDIRELLVSQKVTPIPFLSTQQAVDELVGGIKNKKP